jgi:hypothetical protein
MCGLEPREVSAKVLVAIGADLLISTQTLLFSAVYEFR